MKQQVKITQKEINQAKKQYKGVITKLPPGPGPDLVSFSEDSDYFRKSIDADLWILYYYKKEYRRPYDA